MALAVIIILVLMGIALMLLELFVLPGFLVGLIGLGITAFAVYQAYDSYGQVTGHWMLAGTVILSAVGFFSFFKKGSFSRIEQKGVIDSKANPIKLSEFQPGQHGYALSGLRPSGNAMFGEQRVEVHTQGEFIDSRTEIEIIRIHDNKIYVKKITTL